MIFSTVINISISISRKHVNLLSRGPLSGKQNNHFDFCHSANNDLKPWKSMNKSGDVSKVTTTAYKATHTEECKLFCQIFIIQTKR